VIDLSDTAAYEAAVAALVKRKPALASSISKADPELRARAFTVSGVANLDLVTEVWESLQRSIQDSAGFEEWRASVGPKLEEAWGGAKPGRLQTIWRTNLQSSFSAARWAEMNDPDTKDLRPFVQFDATLDSRTSSICKSCAGTIVHLDSEWAASHTPPLHFNCRSAWITLSEEEAIAAGVAEKPPSVDPHPGFGAVPETPAPQAFEPDLSVYPAELVQAFQDSPAAAPPPVAPPIVLPPPPSNPTPQQDKTAKAAARKLEKALPMAQREAIRAFTGNAFSDMRELDKDPTAEIGGDGYGTKEELLAHLAAIREAFKVAKPFPGVAYRGLADVTEEAYASLMTATEFSTDALSSASRAYSLAKEYADQGGGSTVRAVILVLMQKSGIPVEVISKFDNEKEILIPKGVKFRVTGRYMADGILHVEATEI
jgi:SPP1 gp7 family putative phage head morphogenesis protein